MLALTVVLCLVEPARAISLITGLGGDRGYGEEVLSANDDGSSSSIDITPVFGAAGLNFFGVQQLALYVNNNGNITFNGPTDQYVPTGITAASNPIIAAFFADVDTRGDHIPAGSNLVYYDLDPTNHIFTATWDLVGYYDRRVDKLNNFQIRLIGRSDLAPGDFDIEIRYQQLQWTTGDMSGGHGGLGGSVARAGYAAGNNVNYYEFPEAGDEAAMLDLVNRTNVGIAGLFVFQVRSGVVTPPPTFTPSQTPLGTHTATATASGTPVRTPTRTSTPSATPQSCATCVGDCGCDLRVTVDELLIMVNIVLGSADVELCLPGDGNHDAAITVDEILNAVNSALTECVVPSPTVTPTGASTFTQVPVTRTRHLRRPGLCDGYRAPFGGWNTVNGARGRALPDRRLVGTGRARGLMCGRSP